MKHKSDFVTAIILAAGSSARMMSSLTKQRIKICGESVLCHSVRAFSDCEDIDSIIVVCKADEIEEIKADLGENFPKISHILAGGSYRAESAKIGFGAIPKQTNFVAIHDAARCLVTPIMISSVVNSAKVHGAATAASRITSTVKAVDGDGFILKTLPRESLYIAETPQIFSAEKYAAALIKWEINESITDDNMLMESIGEKVVCVDTGDVNIKITTPKDLSFAEYIINRRKADE